jgi:hypothetical protein
MRRQKWAAKSCSVRVEPGQKAFNLLMDGIDIRNLFVNALVPVSARMHRG